jgi:hypothetical protein
MNPRHRPFALAIAVIAWSGLVLQVVTSLQRSARDGSSPGLGLWQLAGYFTILTNLLVALAFTALVSDDAAAPRSWWRHPGVLSALTVHIVFVGIAYSVLLRSTWQPHGLEIVADEIVHDIVPLLVLVFWWRFVPRGVLQYRQLVRWLAYPLAYLLYALGRGAVEGWYPYYFINVTTMGFPATLATAGAITLTLAAMSALLVFVDRRLGAAT